MRRFFSSLLVFLFISLSLPAEKSGVESLSLASAGRAHWSGKGAFKSNPAALLLDKKVNIGVDYIFYKAFGDQQTRIAVTDSSTTSWGMGFAYSPILNSHGGFNHHDVSALLAIPIVPNVFSLGVGGYYVYNRSLKNSHLFNVDLGLMFVTPVGLNVALVVDHLLKEKSGEKPLGVALGTSYDFRTLLPLVPLSIHSDFAMADFRSEAELKNELALGLQYIALFSVPLRLGVRHENHTKENFLAMGCGFSIEHFSLDAAFEQNLTRGKDRIFAAGLSVSF